MSERMSLDFAMELLRERCWRGAPTDVDQAFDVVFAAARRGAEAPEPRPSADRENR